MFRYDDDLHSVNEYKMARELLDELNKNGDYQYSEEIDKLFSKVTYQYLEDFVKLVREGQDEKIIIVAIPRNHSARYAQMDLDIAYSKTQKEKWVPIPYVEHSFPKDYECPHGIDWMHCYFFFFTPYPEFKDAEKCVTQYLSRLNRLKAFL